MQEPYGALLIWFSRSQPDDTHYLSAWRDTALTYTPDVPLDNNWNVDRYEAVLGYDESGKLFRQASQIIMHNQLYPSEVMTSVSDFGLENRPLRAGDRIVQRVRVFQYNTKPILEALTMNEITEVVNEPRRVGFTYTTTQAHNEIGEWSPRVEWRDNGEVVLIIEVISRSMPGTPSLARCLTRHLQIRAHTISIENFRAQLAGKVYNPRSDVSPNTGHLAPIAAGAISALLAVLLLSRRRR